ncbi:prolyl oligopeptidase family serine peptidase [Rhodococcus sp. HNM0569]|uniref:prolyl oligopeptidase family serine peptidase n=1 Tax=Rhodococcus sp. HNM0569 TaxID=2716340 RepID=UPI00146BD729|nr:prolyl oligopeptidase family serine peptidase [Rhodococcus sp. HNM0569]NLU84015.1 S9 family peptidase [Rhodococcus sp. HNM0569]
MHEGTPFDEFDDYVRLVRVSGLTMSPDGRRLVVTAATLDGKGTSFVDALWEIDATGARPPRRLTWGLTGETGAAFTHDGDLLFTAARAVASGTGARESTDATPPTSLWRLPARGGEAHVVVTRGGAVRGVATAHSAPTFAVSVAMFGRTVDDDARIRGDRERRDMSAVLHTGYPVRHWDHELGPERPHLVAGTGGAELVPDADATVDLAPDAGDALRDAEYVIAPDGSYAVTTWTVPAPLAARRTTLARIDIESGHRTTLVDDPDADLSAPVVAPDGRTVAFLRESVATAERAPRVTLHRCDAASGSVERLVPAWDRWPTSVAWLADGSGLVLTADDHGRAPIFVLREGDSVPRRVTDDDFAYTDVRVAPDGATVFALRSSYAAPPHPVRIDLASGAVTVLATPAAAVDSERLPELPGTLVEVETESDDGVPLRAWMAVPTGAEPHAPVPLLLWIHGGPLSSWNVWSWRWNPWLLVAQGYAVLLPDPALSTGYGQEFVQRGWGRWGREPFTDLMALTDAAVARPEIDAARTGAMGGSFGGYMANWVAGHTNRFRAIVTHAGLWALDQFGPTTDAAWYWNREMTPEMAVENSPHLFVADIATPMLVIHGDKDYRVPVGEALRLWYELLSESGLPADDQGETVHRFLSFPSENHWVLRPEHARVWYQVVEAFLSEHVLGEPAAMPDVLGVDHDPGVSVIPEE